VTARKTGALEARERHLDDAASAKGFVVSKTHSVKQIGRYIIVGQPPKMVRSSHNVEFPYSFSLEEAEAYLALQSDLIHSGPNHRLTPRST
jgi:hypothetical protein